MTEKTYMTADEAAAYLGKTRGSVYVLCSKRLIPFYKPNGGRTYFLREELDKWIAASRVATSAEIQQRANNFSLQKNN